MRELENQTDCSERSASSCEQAWRKRVMAACSRATPKELAHGANFLNTIESAQDIRAPETGLVMLRGRIGGDGKPFNFGEATVTRAVVKLSSGEIGLSYLLGRSRGAARHAAVLDAFSQRQSDVDTLEREFVSVVEGRVSAETADKVAKADATRVDFFTLVRGED